MLGILPARWASTVEKNWQHLCFRRSNSQDQSHGSRNTMDWASSMTAIVPDPNQCNSESCKARECTGRPSKLLTPVLGGHSLMRLCTTRTVVAVVKSQYSINNPTFTALRSSAKSPSVFVRVCFKCQYARSTLLFPCYYLDLTLMYSRMSAARAST